MMSSVVTGWVGSLSAPEIHHGFPFWSQLFWLYLTCSAMKLFALSRLDKCKGDGGVGEQSSGVTCWWSEFAARIGASQVKSNPGVRGPARCRDSGEVTKEGYRPLSSLTPMETNLLFSAEVVALDLGNIGLCTRLSICLECSSSFTACWPNLAICSQGFLDLVAACAVQHWLQRAV